MFTESSSSEEDGAVTRTPFNAIAAAAAAKRESYAKRPFPRAKAAAEDLEAFEYDELQQVADKERRSRPEPARGERKSRYIGKLVAETERRSEELARVRERRLIREQEQEDAQYAGKEKFVTRGYKREIERREEEERKDREEMGKDRGNAREVVRRVFLQRERDEHVEDNEDTKGSRTEADAEHGILAGKAAGDSDLAKRNGEGAAEGRETSTAADHVGKKRRRSRFDVVGENETDLPGPVHESAEKAVGEAGKDAGIIATTRKRGLRRNDEEAILAYRRRYFERMERRRKDGDPLWCSG